jgi:FkbM family methyltransferase
VIIDAGANVGMSAVYFALQYPAAKIVAIEPELTSFRILEKNARLFPQIIPIRAALWDRDGYVHLDDQGTGHWGMRVVDRVSGFAVRSIILPNLLREFGIDRVSLLKVDVEGAECEIFSNATDWIDRIDAICVELHDRFRPGCTEVFNAATTDFPIRWRRGELHCVTRHTA